MRYVVLLTAFLALAACAPLSPPVPVELQEYACILVGETRWSGDVVLAEDVIIPTGSTLTILPGTRVFVRPSVSTKIEPEQLSSATELLIRGRLIARGTSEEPIEFVVEGEHDISPAWAGIIADHSRSFVLDSVHVNRAEQALWLIASRVSVQNCDIWDSRYGMVFQQPGASAIVGNRIFDGEAGIFCWKGASPRLADNIISGHVEEGIFIDAASRPILQANLIEGNGIGLVSADDGFIADNTLKNNTVDTLLLGGAP